MQTQDKYVVMELVNITESAKKRISNFLSANPGKYAVGLSVLGGGCAGFKYDWRLIDTKEEINEDDYVSEWSGGRLVIDEISKDYLSGSEIHWVEEAFGSKFEITNPTSSGGCGCGVSFSA